MEQIEYTRTVVPSSMRSSYWKYFGFPSDNSNNILTRQKIICTLCNTAIAYNKNTSNLRTHLMARHPETFEKLLPNKRRLQVEEESESDNNNKVKFRLCDNDEVIEIESSPSEVVKISQTQSEDLSENIVEMNEIEEELRDSENISPHFNEVNIIQYQEQVQEQELDQQQSLDVMLADMVQKDLLSLSVVKNEGFRTFNQLVSGLSIDDGCYKQMKNILRQRIAVTKGQITSDVQQLSQISPFSLSVECYKSYDDLTVLNVYVNFLNDNQSQINGVLYYNTIVEDDLNFVEILKDVNTNNCKCIVVNDLANINKGLIDFASCHDMDIIECLASKLERCLKKIFNLPNVARKFKELHNHMQNYLQVIEPPPLRILCCWSKLNLLAVVFEKVDDKCQTFCEMKEIYEYIKPLKMAMDIISDEQLPICTLTQPLVLKLFEQNFTELQTNEVLLEIQTILENELKISTEQSPFLWEATYFDARFRHKFFSPNDQFDLNALKTKVVERYKNILDIHYIAPPGSVETASADSVNSKKSTLKAFFDKLEVGALKKSTTTVARTNVDAEFESYHIGSALDLDQCPFKWWQEQLQSYPELNKIVLFYLTTPCCCVRLYHLNVEERWQKLGRRKQLNNYCDIERNLWYLHFNELK